MINFGAIDLLDLFLGKVAVLEEALGTEVVSPGGHHGGLIGWNQCPVGVGHESRGASQRAQVVSAGSSNRGGIGWDHRTVREGN